MSTLTEDRPKCLVELDHKPLIQRQISALRGGGVSTIGIVRGYLGNMIDIDRRHVFRKPSLGGNEYGDVAGGGGCTGYSPTRLLSAMPIFFMGATWCGPWRLHPAIWWWPTIAIGASLWSRRFADPLSDAETFRTDAPRQSDRDRKTRQAN